jgi:hypothetical protein
MAWEGGQDMCAVRGQEAINRLGEMMGVKAEWAEEQTGYRWVLRGVTQRVWAAPAVGADGQLTWRLQLRTVATEGFSALQSQCTILSAVMRPVTLAGLVRRADHPACLELATSLDARGDMRTLAVAAHVQASQARLLSRLKGLLRLGLTPAACAEAAAHASDGDEPAFPWCSDAGTHPDARLFVDEAVSFLRLRSVARVVPMPWGISASFPIGRRGETQSVLEMRTDTDDPLLGKVLTFDFITPLRGGLVEALTWNEFEVRPSSHADALGGWSVTTQGVLVHRFRYPWPLCQEGDALQILLAYARRADDVSDYVAGRR